MHRSEAEREAMFLQHRLHGRMDGTGFYLPDWRDSAWWQANGTREGNGDVVRPPNVDSDGNLNKKLSDWGTTAVELSPEADFFVTSQDNTHSGSA